jgi:hypothetical protein
MFHKISVDTEISCTMTEFHVLISLGAHTVRFIDDDEVFQDGIHAETMLGEHFEDHPAGWLPRGNSI